MKTYTLGIDVGSTTVKTVVCDELGTILHSAYQKETVTHSGGKKI